MITCDSKKFQCSKPRHYGTHILQFEDIFIWHTPRYSHKGRFLLWVEPSKKLTVWTYIDNPWEKDCYYTRYTVLSTRAISTPYPFELRCCGGGSSTQIYKNTREVGTFQAIINTVDTEIIKYLSFGETNI